MEVYDGFIFWHLEGKTLVSTGYEVGEHLLPLQTQE